MQNTFRIGIGYDIHRLVPGRPLVLGGVSIPHDHGLDGHSDADCLSHAIADAILGAGGLPDIGHFFPNTDPRCKNMNSQEIVMRAVAEVRSLGFSVVNIDTAIVAEAPKLAPHLPQMKKVLAASLGVTPGEVGIKVTTNEKLGAIGRREGIAAQAVCLLCRTAGTVIP